jgi:hypothetical protein
MKLINYSILKDDKIVKTKNPRTLFEGFYILNHQINKHVLEKTSA